MSSVGTSEGWHQDPADPNSQRWWDGSQWTANTRPIANWPPPIAPGGGLNIRTGVAKGRHHYSLITLGVCVLYLVIAYVTHFVLIGFVPVAMAVRARRAGEPFAPLAMVIAIGVVILSLLTLIH